MRQKMKSLAIVFSISMGLSLFIYPVSAQDAVSEESGDLIFQIVLYFSNEGDIAMTLSKSTGELKETEECARLLSKWYMTIKNSSKDPFVSKMLKAQIQELLIKPDFKSKEDIIRADGELDFKVLEHIDDEKVRSAIRLDLLKCKNNSRELVFYKSGKIEGMAFVLSWFSIMKYAFQNYTLEDIRFIQKTMSETFESSQRKTQKKAAENMDEPSVEKVLHDSMQRQLCGEYSADSGIYKRFIFGDKNSATIWASGIEFSTTYFIVENTAYINTDKGCLKLLIESPTLLIGNDTWTKGHKYIQKRFPQKKCLPYSLSKSEKAELANQICQMAAVELKGKGKFEEAAAKFLQCCNSGDPISCNSYGLMRDILWNDQKTALKYYEKACSMGYGGGCSNLATHEKKKGNLEEAKRLYEEACSKGFKPACLEAVMME